MKLILDRKWKKPSYTIGNLYVDGQLFCNTIEDKDRGLTQSMPLTTIEKIKIKNETAIPTGDYAILMNIVSPKYSAKSWYIQNCHGAKVPRLDNVKGFSGVLIHTGNTAQDSSGCIIVGKNTKVGMVTNSKETFLTLYNKMYEAHKKGETIILTIK
jgi:hypothetical protein